MNQLQNLEVQSIVCVKVCDIHLIRLGRNVKCACDDCCGLHQLVKRFEEERKPEETVNAKKALIQPKKRADWKQIAERMFHPHF